MTENWTYVRAEKCVEVSRLDGHGILQKLFVLPVGYTEEQIVSAVKLYDLAIERGWTSGRNALRNTLERINEMEDVP